jgi:rubrerythrin
VLQWCRTTLVVAGALGASGCGHWTPGGKTSSVLGPVAVNPQQVGAQPERAECERLCAEDQYSTGACQLATLAIQPRRPPAAGITVPPRGSTVVICEVETSGHWESRSFLPTPFGRRPLEPIETHTEPQRSAREHFERAAAHEAAAVRAFRQLVFDLEELDAPPSMVAQAQRAARDEANHARWTLAVARGFDPNARLPPADRRCAARRRLSAFELALENATAGCVGELFGTWLQVFQARAATQPHVRATARRIARDEARHAALAFRLFDWLNRRLSAREREAVALAMHAEAQLLAGDTTLPELLALQLGLPNAAEMAGASCALQERLRRACA